MRHLWILVCLGAWLRAPLARGGTSPQAPPDSAAAAARSFALPTWRIEADPFNQYGSYSLGVYRRIDEGWDLGLQFATGVGDRNTRSVVEGESREAPYVTYEREGHNTFSLGATLQARTWYPLGGRAAFFLGPQVTYRYQSTTIGGARLQTTDFEDVIRLVRDDGQTQTWGTGLTLGGDLILLPRLSVSIAFMPISYSYSWGDHDSRYILLADHQIDIEDRREEFQRSGFTTRLQGEFFVSFHLQAARRGSDP
jgi:hypothetical protein